MNVRVLLLSILLLSVLAGCAKTEQGQDESPDATRTYGLGIEIPAELPARAPLPDNATDIAKLDAFIRERAPGYYEDCRRTPRQYESTERYLNRGLPLNAMFWLPTYCNQMPDDVEARIVKTAMANGTEQETFDRLKVLAEAAIRNATAALNQTVPGTAVEAQILATIAQNVEYDMAGIRTAELYFIPYLDGSRRDEQQLGFVLGSLWVPWKASEFLVRLMQEYSWTQGSICEAPDAAAIAARIEAKLEHATAIALEVGNPEDAQWISKRMGRLAKDYGRQLEVYAPNGWWHGLLGLESLVDWAAVSYWENYTANPLPTLEESRVLLAQYRSHTHTLWTEYQVNDWERRMDNPYPWEGDLDNGGVIALTLPALQSPFVDLDCHAV